MLNTTVKWSSSLSALFGFEIRLVGILITHLLEAPDMHTWYPPLGFCPLSISIMMSGIFIAAFWKKHFSGYTEEGNTLRRVQTD